MHRHIIIALFLLLVATACEEDDLSTVPKTNVYTRIDIYKDQFSDLAVGTSIALDESYGGYAGFILFQLPMNEIRAFDRCCPIHVDDKEQLEIDGGATAFCPTDSIYFILTDTPPHSLSSDTSMFYMRQYNTNLSSDGILTIYN